MRDPERFSAWAYTIVRRRAADHIDRAVRVRKLEVDTFDAGIGLGGRGSGPDTRLSLRQALAQLPDADRLMLTLFYVEGLHGAEMAAALRIPLGTLKSRLFTARRKLKQIYETEVGESHD